MFSIIVAEPTKHCKDGEFQCGNSDQCIPESKVCDAQYDCSNNMDEPMSCGELNGFFWLCLYLWWNGRENPWQISCSTSKKFRKLSCLFELFLMLPCLFSFLTTLEMSWSDCVASFAIKEKFSRLSRVKVCYVNWKFVGLFHIFMFVFSHFRNWWMYWSQWALPTVLHWYKNIIFLLLSWRLRNRQGGP